jgi:hypothetical protein
MGLHFSSIVGSCATLPRDDASQQEVESSIRWHKRRLIGRQSNTRRVTVPGFPDAAHFGHTNVDRNARYDRPIYPPRPLLPLNHSHQAPNSSVE